MKPVSPCKGCDERTEYGTCHSTCNKYLDYKKQIDEIHKFNEKDYVIRQYCRGKEIKKLKWDINHNRR